MKDVKIVLKKITMSAEKYRFVAMRNCASLHFSLLVLSTQNALNRSEFVAAER